MIIIKKFIFYLVNIILIFSLISCSKIKSKQITIEFFNWESSPEGMKFINKLIKEFEKQNPDIKIKNNVVGGDFTSLLLTRFAGGTPPDIFEIQAEIIYPFLKKGLLLNLTPYIKKSNILKEEDFFPISLINFRYDGKNFRRGDLYGFPKDFGTAILLYNKDLFDKVGISYPNSSWSKDDYLRAAQKLTKRDASDRVISLGIDERSINPMHILLQNGGKIWSDDYKKCLLDSEESISAYQFVYDLSEKYKVAPKAREIREGLLEEFGFKSGRTGMSMRWRYELPDIVKYIGNRFKWDVCSHPKFAKYRRQLFHGPSGWSISNSTKYPEACFRFMEFLVGEQGQIETAKLGWNIPGNKKIANSEYFLLNLPRPDSEKINRTFLEEIEYFDYTLLNPYIQISKVYNILGEELDAAVIKKYNNNVKEGLIKAVKRINKELESNF